MSHYYHHSEADMREMDSKQRVTERRGVQRVRLGFAL